MDKMLVVVLNGGGIGSDEINFQLSLSPSENMAAGNACIDLPLDNVLELFCSEARDLMQTCSDYCVATCLSEAESLLKQQQFDVLLLDLTVFDGKTHHLVSQLKESSACLFSRIEVEGSCWWLPESYVKFVRDFNRLRK